MARTTMSTGIMKFESAIGSGAECFVAAGSGARLHTLEAGHGAGFAEYVESVACASEK